VRTWMHMVSDDPVSEKHGADIIGLYLNPAQHAAVFCVDEAMAIPGRGPLGEGYPLSSAWVERDNPNRRCHGALSLCANFELGTGEACGSAVSPHTLTEFVTFLTDIAVSQPYGKEIHVVADNLSAHKTIRANDFLQAHRTIHLHFVPSFTSWLGELDLWLSKIEREMSVSDSPTSGPEVKKNLVHHIRAYNKAQRTLKWKYFNPTRRIIGEADGAIH
jgi:hypothetical protein